MRSEQTSELAKEAYFIAGHFRELQNYMQKAGDNYHGLPACSRTWNRLLARAKEILKLHPTIYGIIEHFQECEPDEEGFGRGIDFESIKAYLSILASALRSSFAFHFPSEEKEGVGFSS